MQEERLRELGASLRSELGSVIDDENERDTAAAELDAALALPPGEAKDELVDVLRARPQTRSWVAARIQIAELDQLRAIPGLPGISTEPLGVHFVCPKGDYDKYLETAGEEPGRCPYDGLKLVRSGDD